MSARGSEETSHQPSRRAIAPGPKQAGEGRVTRPRYHHYHTPKIGRETTRHPQFSGEANCGHWDQCFSEPKPRGSGDY
jgi:hypothetical protein